MSGTAQPSRPGPVTATRRRRRIGPWLLLFVLGVAALLYQPWSWRPIGSADAAEYVLVLQQGRSTAERFWLLTTYYVENYGRFNVVVFAALALKWTAFGGAVAWWYWSRFAVMAGVVGITYAFLRRTGAESFGAALGAAMFVVGTSVVRGWLVLSIGEPIGTLFFVTALLLAAGYRTTAHWRTTGLLIAVCCAGAVLAKEMLVFTVPVVLLVGMLFDRGDGWVPAMIRERAGWLVTSCAATLGLASAGVLWAAWRTATGGYGRAYRVDHLSLTDTMGRLTDAVFPVAPTHPSEPAASLVANCAYVIALWSAYRGSLVDPGSRRTQTVAWVGAALVTPVLCVALYAPWPTYVSSHALPTAIGPAVLVAYAVTVTRGARRLRRLVVGSVLVMETIATSFAWRHARSSVADLRTIDRAVQALTALPGLARLTLRTRPVPARVWLPGNEVLRHYARAFHGRTLPAGATIPCSQPWRPLGRGTVVVSVSKGCGRLPGATSSQGTSYPYFDWSRLVIARDSIYIDEQVAGGSAGAVR